MSQRPLTDFSKPLASLVEWSEHHPSGTALDIGTGNGRNALYLARQGWQVTATDVDRAALDELKVAVEREHLPIQLVAGDIMARHGDLNYNLVMCLMVLHFLHANQIAAAIEQIKASTKPGGTCMVSAFTAANPPGTRPYQMAQYELKSYFSGWTIEHYDEDYGGWILPPGKTEPERYVAARIRAQKPLD